MIPPLTLPDSRQEAFAYHIASGLSPSSAYTAAGFSPNNAKARAQELLQDPDIADRIGHLKFSLPKAEELKDRYAPSLLLMPQTQEEMLAWLWQVMSGTRKILPIQMRAATLFARMNGWHLAKPPPPEETPKPKPKPVPLIPQERQALVSLSDITFSSDITHIPCHPDHIQRYHSQMADLAFVAGIHHPEERRVNAPSPAILLRDNTEAPAPTSPPQTPATTPPATTPAPNSKPQAPGSMPESPSQSPIPPTQPLKSPSHPIDPQPITPPNPQKGKNSNHIPHDQSSRRACMSGAQNPPVAPLLLAGLPASP